MISAVVLAKNEEKGIRDCLLSLRWVDEKIVIDDFSTDKTVEVAEKMGARVYKKPLQNNFAEQRNFGLEKANGDWVLFVDADERVGHSLQYEMTSAINDSMGATRGYFIKRDDILWGRKLKHGEIGTVSLLRLARKGSGRWRGAVHEEWDVKGKKETLKHHLSHYPHPTIREFLQEINYYSSLRAMELHRKRKKVNSVSIVIFPFGKFIYNYFFRLGILDGIPGLIVAVFMSFHSFLAKGKLWLLWKR